MFLLLAIIAVLLLIIVGVGFIFGVGIILHMSKNMFQFDENREEN